MDTDKPQTARLRVVTRDPKSTLARRVDRGIRKGRQPWQSKRPIRRSRDDLAA
jgi:hypothetical protein